MTPADILPIIPDAPVTATAAMWVALAVLAVLAHAVVWEAAQCQPIR